MPNVKSTSITNRDAVPAVLNTAGLGAAARLKEAYESVTTTTGGTATDKYIMIEVPTTARVGSVQLQAAAMTQGSFNVGVYANTKAGGTAIDATFFAAAVSCATAVAPTEIKHQSGSYAINEQSMPLWQAVGLTADPGGTFDIALASSNTITLGALVGLKAQWA